MSESERKLTPTFESAVQERKNLEEDNDMVFVRDQENLEKMFDSDEEEDDEEQVPDVDFSL